MNFNVEIKNKEMSAVAGYIVCGNSDYSITFAFDSEWAGLPVKTARFIYTQADQVHHRDVVFEGNTVQVPILRGITEVFVGVFAGELHTTTPLRIPCKKSILCGDDSIQDEPTPDVYAQILDLVNNKIVGERELPEVSADDKGKVLVVGEDGAWGTAEEVANAKNADKLDGYHINNLFKSPHDWVNKTTGLKYSFEILATEIHNIGGDNNTYIPVFIPLPDEVSMPARLSIVKRFGESCPIYPGSVSGQVDKGSLWLLYEGRTPLWDGNSGFIKTLYANDAYPNLCLKASCIRSRGAIVRHGLIVWLRAGLDRSSRYTIYSNYPITGNTPQYITSSTGAQYDAANVQVIYEEVDYGATSHSTGEAYPFVVKPENVPDSEFNSGLYNHGVINLAYDGPGEEYMGYCTEAERAKEAEHATEAERAKEADHATEAGTVNKTTPTIIDGSIVRFYGEAEIERTVTIRSINSDYIAGQGNQYNNFIANNADLVIGSKFQYNEETAVVVDITATVGNGGQLGVIKIPQGGAIAQAEGQTIVIGYKKVKVVLPVENAGQVNGVTPNVEGGYIHFYDAPDSTKPVYEAHKAKTAETVKRADSAYISNRMEFGVVATGTADTSENTTFSTTDAVKGYTGIFVLAAKVNNNNITSSVTGLIYIGDSGQNATGIVGSGTLKYSASSGRISYTSGGNAKIEEMKMFYIGTEYVATAAEGVEVNE